VEQLVAACDRVSDCTPTLTSRRRRWLEQLDRVPGPLLAHLAERRSHRLGVYFEQLWHFFLSRDPDTDLVAHNLPVHDNGRTLGEFDCVYYCHRRQRHVHLELAVKFYLAHPDTRDHESNAHHWLGPDARDRLDLKVQRLLQRQIALGDHPAARRQLDTLGVAQPVREIAFKGYLFRHVATTPPPPPGYSLQRPMDNWLFPAELPAYCDSLATSAFQTLSKDHWLSAAVHETPDVAMSAAELHAAVTRHFSTRHYPLLVAGLDDAGVEAVRFFVVPDTWPRAED